MTSTFFGLSHKDKANLILEPAFLLMYYLGFSYTESRFDIPVEEKRWFIRRISQELERANGQSKSAESNTPDMRALQGKMRSQVPAKLRRFT